MQLKWVASLSVFYWYSFRWVGFYVFGFPNVLILFYDIHNQCHVVTDPFIKSETLHYLRFTGQATNSFFVGDQAMKEELRSLHAASKK